MGNNDALVSAIAQRERAYSDALERLRSAVENDPRAWNDAMLLREAVELVRCLRRLVPACTVLDLHPAFGAPGDFGYETPIGDALARVYHGKP